MPAAAVIKPHADPDFSRVGSIREFKEQSLSLASCFERVAFLHAHSQAIRSDSGQISYAELNAAANRIAHAIVAAGGTIGDRVAILMEHDIAAIVAIVGVIKAGRIGGVLNSTHPIQRLQQIIGNSEPGLLLTDKANRELAEKTVGAHCNVLIAEEASSGGPDHNLNIEVPSERIAFLGYTSGSTGTPKAVQMTHDRVRWGAGNHTEAMRYSAQDRLSLFGSLSGGQGTSNSWAALLNGATLCPFPVPVKGVTGLADWIERHGVTVYASSASIFRNFISTLEEGRILPSVRAVRLSSEPATSDDFQAFRDHFPDDAIFVHSLSSSETGNIAWSRRTKDDRIAEGRLPIGLPTEGTELLLLDENGRPVGPNEVGEIAVRSRYMSNGYWRDPELTAKRFSKPLDAQGTRQFRTGDLGRFNADGLLEFCGRVDDRVKIRGNRIEPGEIEAALLSLPGIERAIVEAIARTGKEPILVGFVKLQREGLWSGQDLRKSLRVTLPDHMVPSDFVMLGSIPIATSGKVDREKLRASYRPSRVPRADESPRTPTEKRLAEIWAGEFEVSDIGRNEDFFALGGDSLIAAIVAAKIYDERGVELNLAMFAEHPTIADLAQAIDSFVAPSTEAEPPIV